MGTNFYWHEKPPCECCGHADEPLHIGKSSAGWCFGLHVIPENGIDDLDDWEELWERPGSWIVDEYGDQLTPAEMRKIITERTWPHKKDNFDYRGNYAVPGPKGLIRHLVDGRHCIKHGVGTWDCEIGEFS